MKLHSALIMVLLLTTILNTNSQVRASTYKVSNLCFESSNNSLDTGYRSKIFNNSSSTIVKSVSLAFSNITVNSLPISSENYDFGWNYMQTNIFSNETISNTQTNKITINLNDTGYLNNHTAIVWKLTINSSIEGQLGVCVSSSQITSGTIEFNLTFINEDPSIDEKGSDNSNNYILFTALFGVLILFGLIIRKRK